MKHVMLILLVLLAGCTTRYSLTTDDGEKITYEYIEGGSKGIIFLHGLGGSINDWKPLKEALKEDKFSMILIDFRGHGQNKGKWEDFETEDFQDMIYDARIAEKMLRSEGVIPTIIIGADLGANLGLKLAIEKDIGKVILLSPGSNYKGITISKEISNYTGQSLIFSGKADSASYTTSQVMKRNINTTAIVVSGDKRGTEMLPDINPHILQFLRPTLTST